MAERRLAASLDPARVSAASAGAVAGWILASLFLLLLHGFVPVTWWLVAAPAAAAGAVGGWCAASPLPWPVLPAVAATAITAATIALAWVTASAQAFLRRDPGSYLLTAGWLAHHGSLTIPAHAEVFDGIGQPDSPGYYTSGDTLTPQFMSGWPSMAAVAIRYGGLGSGPRADAVLAGLAVLAVIAIAARWLSPWWSVLAGASYAATMPLQHVARDGLSEPGAALLVIAGVALLVDADRGGRRWSWAAGGLLAGVSVLIRIDGLADVVLLAAWLALRTRDEPGGWAGLAGLFAGIGAGLVDAEVLSRPYLGHVGRQVLALGILLVLSVPVALAVRGPLHRIRLPRHTPALTAAVVPALAVLLVVRLVAFPARSSNPDSTSVIASIQRLDHLPLDPTRTYAERAIAWLTHWAGQPTVLAALLTAAVAAAAVVAAHQSEQRPRWLPASLVDAVRRGGVAPALLVAGPATLQLLVVPSIFADQPWADRRLVPIALPAVAVCAVVAVAAAARWLARSRTVLAGLISAAVAAALVVPAAAYGWGLAWVTTEAGEVAALRDVCTAVPGGGAVILVGGDAARNLAPGLRDVCGDPAVTTFPTVRAWPGPGTGGVLAAERAAERHGRAVALVTCNLAIARGWPGARHVVSLPTLIDRQLLTTWPTDAAHLTVDVWVLTVSS